MIIDTFSLSPFFPSDTFKHQSCILINPEANFTTFLTHFVVFDDFDDYFLLDDRKIRLFFTPKKKSEVNIRRGSISNERRKSRKMFYSSGFHEWRASHNQFTPFSSACLLWWDHETATKPQQWFLIERNHYVIIAIMIFILSTDAHDERSGKKGIWHLPPQSKS